MAMSLSALGDQLNRFRGGNRAKNHRHRERVTKQHRLRMETLESRRLLAAETVGVVLSQPDEIADGYTLFSPSRGRETFLIDREGAVVNSWESVTNPGTTAYLHTDGSLYRSGQAAGRTPRMAAPGSGGLIEKFDWDGNLVWRHEINTDFELMHHDIEVMPNGNVLVMIWEYKSRSESLAAGRSPSRLPQGYLIPDSILELKPTGLDSTEVVWRWNTWDHLVQEFDATKENFGSVAANPQLIDLNYVPSGPGVGAVPADWTHGNGIDYNADLDQIVISLREFSEFWIIDHSTTTEEAAGHTGGDQGMGGDLLFRWGNPAAHNGGTRADQRLFYQHDAEWIDNDTIVVFNNGTNRRDGSNYSSVDEIDLPLLPGGSYDLAATPSDAVDRIVGSPLSSFYAPITSGHARLENGNTLVTNGPRGVISEVNPEGETVWQYVNPVVSPTQTLRQGQTPGPFNLLNIPGVRSNLFFKAEHYAPDYGAFDGRTLIAGPKVEIYPDSPLLEFGYIDATPVSGSDSEEYIELINRNGVAVDLSDWTLSDGVEFTFPAGTSIPANSVLYVVADEAAFNQRATGPGGGMNLLVVGDYTGDLDPAGETLILTNDNNETNAVTTFGRSNIPPVVAAIDDQRVTAGRTTDPIAIDVTDPDTDAADLRYLVVAEELTYVLDQELDLDAPRLAPGDLPYHFNYRGQAEKYLSNFDGVSPADRWYYLLPGGDLYRFTGDVLSPSPDALRGQWIANVGADVYADPRRLHDSTTASVPVIFGFTGNTPNEVTVTPSASYLGDVPVTVTVLDGDRRGFVSFNVESVESTNLLPEIEPLDNVIGLGVNSVTQALSASDPDMAPEELFFDVSVTDLNYYLDQEYQLSSPSVFPGFLPYYEDYRGSGEKYLVNPAGTDPTRWFYILPDGDLYQFTGVVSSSDPSSLTGNMIASVGEEVYEDPSLLFNAPDLPSPVTATFEGAPIDSVVTMVPEGVTARAFVTVSVTDGEATVEASYEATFVASPTFPPVISPIANQTVDSGNTVDIPLSFTDADTALEDVEFDLQIGADEDLLELLGELNAPVVATGFPAYYESYRGQGEKYLFNSSRPSEPWYYLLPNGEFYRFTGDVGSSSASSLTGDLLINAGEAIYDDPSLIAGITPPSVFSFTGSPVDNLSITAPGDFTGVVDVTVIASDGINSASETFQLTVQPPAPTGIPFVEPIDDVELAANDSILVEFTYSDPDTSANDLSIQADVEALVHRLDRDLNLTEPSTGSLPSYFQNYRGSEEKYLLNPDGVNPNRWYYLLPNGDFYRFTGNVLSSSPASLTGDLLANLGPAVYEDPSILHEDPAFFRGVSSFTMFAGSPGEDSRTGTITYFTNGDFDSPVAATVVASDPEGNVSETVEFLLSPVAPVVIAKRAEGELVSTEWPEEYRSAAAALSLFGDPEIVAQIPDAALNRFDRSDVNGDSRVSALDALEIVNFLGRTAPIERPYALQQSILNGGPIFDANHDGNVTSLDALWVINRLSTLSLNAAAEGEAAANWQSNVDRVYTADTDDDKQPGEVASLF